MDLHDSVWNEVSDFVTRVQILGIHLSFESQKLMSTHAVKFSLVCQGMPVVRSPNGKWSFWNPVCCLVITIYASSCMPYISYYFYYHVTAWLHVSGIFAKWQCAHGFPFTLFLVSDKSIKSVAQCSTLFYCLIITDHKRILFTSFCVWIAVWNLLLTVWLGRSTN